LVSAKEAEVYLHFLESGSTAGMTEAELRAVRRIEELIQSNKIDYNGILRIRNETVKSDVEVVRKTTEDSVEDVGKSAAEDAGKVVESGSKSGSVPGVYTDKIKWGIHEIDVRPDGNGFWGQRIRQNNPRVDGYELKINPQNESYYLPHPEGGYVQFENMINSTVQDGKLVMQQK